MRRLGVVAIVVVGLLALLDLPALLGIPATIFPAYLDRAGDTPAGLILTLAFVPAVVGLAIGVTLILSRTRIANRLFGESELSGLPSGVDLLRVALLYLGLTLIVGVISSLAMAATNIGTTYLIDDPMLGTPSSLAQAARLYLHEFVAIVVSGVIGWLLLAKSEAIAARLWWGRPKIEPVAPAHACPNCGTGYDPDDYRADADSTQCVECGESLEISRA